MLTNLNLRVEKAQFCKLYSTPYTETTLTTCSYSKLIDHIDLYIQRSFLPVLIFKLLDCDKEL